MKNLKIIFVLSFTFFIHIFIPPVYSADTGSSSKGLDSLSEKELSNITGREGVKLRVDSWEKFSASEIRFTDDDGHAGGTEGSVIFGNGDANAVNLSKTSLTGITLDVDGNSGIVFQPPSGSLNFSINETYLGTGGTTFGLEILDMDVNQSNILINSQ